MDREVELRKILDQIEKLITETGVEKGAAILLKAIQMKIDVLGFCAPKPGKTPEKEDAVQPLTGTGPEYAFDPAMDAAMQDPKFRARVLALEKKVAKKGKT